MAGEWGASVKAAVRFTTVILAAAALGSCSSGYFIRAVVVDGQIAFVPTDTDIWGEPDCIYSIDVSTKDGPPATAQEGDNAGMVTNGMYWNQSFAVTSCENPFPVIYGSRLKGPPFREVEEYRVEAKPLRIDVVYQVSTASNGSAYGYGKFMITDDRKIVNLPL